MAPPTLSSEQRSAATAKAIANRRRRAEVKQQLRLGELTWPSLIALAGEDEVVAGMKVAEALSCVPGVGPQRIARFMKAAGVAPTRRLRGLGHVQVASLTEALAR